MSVHQPGAGVVRKGMTVGEVASVLGVSRTVVRYWIDHRGLPAAGGGDRSWRRVDPEDLIAFLDRTKRNVPQSLRAWQLGHSPEEFCKAAEAVRFREERSKAADQAWREYLKRKVTGRTRQATLDNTVWSLVSTMTPLQRRGFLQAVADVVETYDRIDEARKKNGPNKTA